MTIPLWCTQHPLGNGLSPTKLLPLNRCVSHRNLCCWYLSHAYLSTFVRRDLLRTVDLLSGAVQGTSVTSYAAFLLKPGTDINDQFPPAASIASVIVSVACGIRLLSDCKCTAATGAGGRGGMVYMWARGTGCLTLYRPDVPSKLQ